MTIQVTTIVDLLAWLLGGTIVAVFSWNYFNLEAYYFDNPKKGQKPLFTEPVLPRFATSPARYWKWFSVFLFITLLLYFLVAYFLDQQVGTIQGASSLEWYKAYNQIFAALLISGLANAVPKEFVFIDILKLLRNFTHMRAKIPERAVTIFRNIMNNDLNIKNVDAKSAIDFVGRDYLTEEDFAETGDSLEPNTIEKNWTKTCHLLTQIHRLTENAESRYSYNLSKPELVYDQARQNFDIIKVDIKDYKQHRSTYSRASLKERTRALLKQFSKLIVCLVFASETKEELIYRKLQQLGINCRKKPRYEINVSFLLAGLTAFAFITFIIAYVLGMSLRTTKISATTSILIGLGAAFIICAPIISVFGIKIAAGDFWPIRGQFSLRQPSPPIFMFFVGIGVGVLGFYLTDYTGLFGSRGWTFYLPYVMLAGVGAAMTATVIDFKPRLWKGAAFLERAFFVGVAGALLFFIFGFIATLWVYDPRAADLTSLFIKKNAYTLILLPSIGFLSGITISFLSELAIRVQNEAEELSLNLSEYLLPTLGYENVTHLDFPNLNQLLQRTKESLPPRFNNYLTDRGFLSPEGDLTEQSFRLLKADLKMAA
jgi:hypothetical protein